MTIYVDKSGADMDVGEVEVFDDGHVGLAGTSYLAGAGHLLDRDIANFVNSTGCSICDAVKLCTFNPVKLISLSLERISIKQGAKADLVVFRYEAGDSGLDIEAVY